MHSIINNKGADEDFKADATLLVLTSHNNISKEYGIDSDLVYLIKANFR